MDALDRLEEQLLEQGVLIDWCALRKEGYFQQKEGEAPYIAVNPTLPRRRKTAVAYHEAGHLHRGLGSVTGKNERRADEWAELQLIHVERIIKAVMCGCTSVHDLAEELGLDEELLTRFLERMAEQYQYYEFGEYVLCFRPIMVHRWTTGQNWPEF